MLGRESQFTHIHFGPYKVLLDTKGILAGAVFPSARTVLIHEQIETLRRLISWFWHDLCHHFITPLARGQLWSAYGGLQDLRLTCVNLARLTENFSADLGAMKRWSKPYLASQLAALEATCCPLERDACSSLPLS